MKYELKTRIYLVIVQTDVRTVYFYFLFLEFLFTHDYLNN